MRVFISYKTDTRYRFERSTIEAHRILHYSTSLPCRIVPIHGIMHCITYTNIHTSWAIRINIQHTAGLRACGPTVEHSTLQYLYTHLECTGPVQMLTSLRNALYTKIYTLPVLCGISYSYPSHWNE